MRVLKRPAFWVALATAAGLLSVPTLASAAPLPASSSAVVQGPIPGALPGDPAAPDVDDTYPWMSTNADLASRGYVEEEFYVSGAADAFASDGTLLAADVPYKTRLIVRRPSDPRRFNGTAIAEWQNVTAGYDLDALWATDQITRAGYAWVGISAQRVGVQQLTQWSPARYGDLDVTGGGRFTADELSYDIYAQAAGALRNAGGALGARGATTLIGAGASQSAGRMTIYYDRVLPQKEKVFDGYAFIVGSAPARRGPEPIFHVLSETDVRTPVRAPDTDTYRRWEVAGAAHSGYFGNTYREPILARDLGEAPARNCDLPPFSRVPLHHAIASAYDHLVKWINHGTPPPQARPLEFTADGALARDEHGLAKGGIRLSQMEAPIAVNTGINTGESFCRLYGTHQPFTSGQLATLYASKGQYVSKVTLADNRAVQAGHLLPTDARQNRQDALEFNLGG